MKNGLLTGISACLIVKDEESNLKKCLESFKEYVDEIILVDTGSKDNTKEIADIYQCKIFNFNWVDDFSAARNFAISKCSYSHILSIDADERVVNPENLKKIILNANSNTGGYLVELFSESLNSDGKPEMFTNKVIRLFKNHSEIRFQGIIHEQIIYSIERLGLKIENTDLLINHSGYSLGVNDMIKKYRRNLNLLNIAIDQNLTNGYYYYQRAKTFLALNELSNAEIDFKKALELNPKTGSVYLQTLNFASISAYRSLNFSFALTRAKESLKINTNQVFPNFILGEIYTQQKNFAEAYEHFKLLQNVQNNIGLTEQISGDYFIPNEQINFRLGRSLLNLNLIEEAIKEFQEGYESNPNDTSNIVGLANIAFKQNNFDIAAQLLTQASALEPNNDQIKKFYTQVRLKEKQKVIPKNNISETNEQPFLSLIMIVKNEERYLEGCLESMNNVADEMIIVDTGSTDATKIIAEKYNAKIYNYSWADDFASARNESLKHAKGEWLIYLDADERLRKKDGKKLRNILQTASDNIGAFVVTIESKHLQMDDSSEIHRGGYPRIIRNYGYPTIHFKGKVHEQITPSLFALNKSLDFTDIVIEHLGYNISREEMDSKVRRNYKMLIQHVKEEPLNSYAWYQLGQTLAQLKLFNEAENAIRMSLKTGKLSDSVYASATATLAQLIGGQKKFEEALHFAEESLKAAPEQLYALHLKAYALMYLNRFDESEIAFNEVLIRLKRIQGVPRSGFDIVIPEEIVLKGLDELRAKMSK